MYGIPDNTDLSAMIGHELGEVRISRYLVKLNFDGNLAIDIESEYDHLVNGKNVSPGESFPDTAASLVSLIEESIIAATVENNQVLALEFTGGHTLRLRDSNQSFESFHIVGPGIDLLV